MPSTDSIPSPSSGNRSKFTSYCLPENIINHHTNNCYDDDSFARDLLQQFDKRRSLLHIELGFQSSQESSPEPSITFFPAPPVISTDVRAQSSPPFLSNDEQIGQQQDEDRASEGGVRRHSSTGRRSRHSSKSKKEAVLNAHSHISSSNNSNNKGSHQNTTSILRKSSAYLKSKFDLLKKKQQEPQPEQTFHDRSMKDNPTKTTMAKVCMQTTITIPSKKSQLKKNKKENHTHQPQQQEETHHAQQLLQQFPFTSLPTINQYPPKPLVYSSPSIEPSDQEQQQQQQQRTLLHRISMPLLSSDPFKKTTLVRHKNKSMTSLNSAFKRRSKSITKV
ncbi:hypothetical protein BDF20DRAFT_862816 [Mycotypha africana]|uniref:uncharacterized protein n=1 Tax=Mycotypha africana TaxID=64632 RepID=UPI002300B741|nr:uncharacterized protein BDF20DRAFT_862816 [Mycotypha africana]KAI8981717.1 hypothetical protein BDF20DRAFT_862816 [Mycotypha africana]